MSYVLFQVNGDEREISKIFQKYYGGNCIEQRKKDELYINCTIAPDYCQLIGLSNRNTGELEKIAKLLSNPSGGRKIDAYNNKKIQLQKKLNATKSAVSSERMVNFGGYGVTTVNEFVGSIDKHMDNIKEDQKVRKAQQKLDKYLDKKQQIGNAQHYSLTSSASVGNGLISFGAGMQSQNNNIFELIDKIKKVDSDFVESSYETFMNMIKELSGHATEIGVMPIIDGMKKPDSTSRKTIRINELKIEDLVNAKNRELVILLNK